MKKFSALALLASAIASTHAVAADSSLAGLYVGGNLGIATPTMTLEDSDCWYNCSAYTLNPSGLTYGLQVGQNFVNGSLLLGWSLDYNLASIDETYDYGFYTGPNDDMRIESEFKSALSLRGKAGMVVDKTAVVLSFGPAQGDFETTFSDRNNNLSNPGVWDRATLDDTVNGFVYGLGIEHAWSDTLLVSVDLSKYDFEGEDGLVIENPSATQSNYKVKFLNSLDTVRVSANYKF